MFLKRWFVTEYSFSNFFLSKATQIHHQKNHSYVPLRLISLAYLFAFAGSSKIQEFTIQTNNLKALTRSTYPMQLVQTMKLPADGSTIRRHQVTKYCVMDIVWPSTHQCTILKSCSDWTVNEPQLSYQGFTWVTYDFNPHTSSS
jgi:ribosomal protein L32